MFIYKCAAYVEQNSSVDRIFAMAISVSLKFLKLIFLFSGLAVLVH